MFVDDVSNYAKKENVQDDKIIEENKNKEVQNKLISKFLWEVKYYGKTNR